MRTEKDIKKRIKFERQELRHWQKKNNILCINEQIMAIRALQWVLEGGRR